MTDPVDTRTQEVQSVTPPPPPAAGPPAAAAPATRVVSSRTSSTPAGFRLRQVVWTLLVIVELILALRFIFYAAGANNVGFAHYVYKIGGALDAPFRGIFNTTTSASGHPLQWADVLAFVVYAVAAWIVAKLITIASTPSSRSAAAPY